MPFILLTTKQDAVIARRAVADLSVEDVCMPFYVREFLQAHPDAQVSGASVRRNDGTLIEIKPVSWEALGWTWMEVLASWNDRYAI